MKNSIKLGMVHRDFKSVLEAFNAIFLFAMSALTFIIGCSLQGSLYSIFSYYYVQFLYNAEFSLHFKVNQYIQTKIKYLMYYPFCDSPTIFKIFSNLKSSRIWSDFVYLLPFSS